MATIDKLSLEINAKVNADTKKINNLSKALEKLQVSVSKNFSNLEQVIKSLSGLQKLSSLKDVSSSLGRISRALEKLKAINFSGFGNKISAVVTALKPLQTLSAEGVASVGSGINRFVNSLTKLKTVDTTNLAADIQKIAIAIRPLTDEFLRAGTSANSYANALYEVRRASYSANAETAKLRPNLKKTLGTFLRFSVVIMLARRLSRVFSGLVEETASWVENLNLFAVTYGKGEYEEILDWVTDLAQQLGFANNELLKFTGLFKQLSTAIGITNEVGTDISKVLTQLGADISSFYNISVESAMEKIRAGIFSGQTKPLRAVGIDVTYQSIDNLLDMNDALSKFNMSSKKLIQSQKAIARTIILLNSAKNAWGDTADTIDSLENTLKIYQASIRNLKLALGDLIHNYFKNIIIGINGIMIGMTNIVRAFTPLTNRATQELPDQSIFSEINEDAEELAETIGLLSFDYFNVLDSGSGTQDEDLSITKALTEELQRQIELYNTDFNNAMSNIQNKSVQIGESIRDWFVVDTGNIDEVGNAIYEISTRAKEAFALIIALFAPVVLKGFLKLGKVLLGVKTGMTGIQFASNALVTGGIMLLAYSITRLITDWENMTTAQKAVYISLGAIGLALTALGITLKLVILQKTKLATATTALTGATTREAYATTFANAVHEKSRLAILKTVSAVGLLIAGLALLTIGTIAFIKNFNELSNAGKWVVPLVALAGAITAVALAVAAFHASWTVGLAVGAIVGGIALLSGTFLDLKRQQKEMQFLADGGAIDTKGGDALAVVNEYGNDELVYSNDANQIEVSNQRSLENSFVSALQKIFVPMMSEAIKAIKQDKNGDIYLDKTKVGETVAKASHTEMQRLGLQL